MVLKKMSPNLGTNREVLSVTDLNQVARRFLEGEFPNIWVEGEVSNFVQPSSGHWYFTLKDAAAQIRCVMFRNRNRAQRTKLQDGSKVLLRGKLSLYEGRGDFQLLVDTLEDIGDGELLRAFEQLKVKLEKEGLFNAENKKSIPSVPKHVGVITSPSGAAIRDVLNILERRFPAIKVSILPVQVQGKEAVRQIREALVFANKYKIFPFDILLLTRGGGSLEDLWPFSSEIVARTIAEIDVPIVSAIGHETDTSIADFVADLRAPTPSAAAELISPDQQEWAYNLDRIQKTLTRRISITLRNNLAQMKHLGKRLQHPRQRLRELNQRIDNLELRLLSKSRFDATARQIESIQDELIDKVNMKMSEQNNCLINLIQRLHTLSPLATLKRGYSITTHGGKNGTIVRNATNLKINDVIDIRLGTGMISAEVKDIYDS